MRLVYPAVLLSLAFAAPAWGADATLEGYGGDGALLVGIDSKDSPFGDAAPQQQQQGGGRSGGGDGNLVAESGPVGSRPAGTTAPDAPATDTAPPAAQPRSGGHPRKPAQNREKTPPAPRDSVTSTPAPAPAPAASRAEPGSSASSGLFTGRELSLLLASLLLLLAMGVVMRRLNTAQPRF